MYTTDLESTYGFLQHIFGMYITLFKKILTFKCLNKQPIKSNPIKLFWVTACRVIMRYYSFVLRICYAFKAIVAARNSAKFLQSRNCWNLILLYSLFSGFFSSLSANNAKTNNFEFSRVKFLRNILSCETFYNVWFFAIFLWEHMARICWNFLETLVLRKTEFYTSK